MYELVQMDDDDRVKLINLMEPNPMERKRIRVELSRVSTADNAAFLQRPLMVRAIIQLIIERKVNMERIKNSSELY